MDIDGKLRDILRLAAQTIRENGWCRYVFKNADGEYCVRGAIGHASSQFEWADPEDRFKAIDEATAIVWNNVEAEVRRTLPGLGHVVTQWNDHICKDIVQAVSLLEEVAGE